MGEMEKKTLQEKEPLTLIRAHMEREYKQRVRIQQKPEIGVRNDQETRQAIGSCRNLGESMDFSIMRNKNMSSVSLGHKGKSELS